MPRFARRARWSLTPDVLPRALGRAREAGRSLIDLTTSNPTEVGLEHPWPEIAAALARGAREPYRPEPLGIPSARAAVAAELGVDPDRVVLTASTSEAYGGLARLLLDPGEAMLVPCPSYPLLGWIADLADVEAEAYPLLADLDFRLDRSAFAAMLAPRHRLVVAVSPDHPTGAIVDREDLGFLLDGCARHGASLVLDEVFRDYRLAPGAEAGDLAREPIPAGVVGFSLGGLSKSLAQPGLKLAWTVVHGAERDAREVLARLEVLLDASLSLAMPVQAALPELLALAPAVRTRVRERLEANLRSVAELDGGSLTPVRVAGGWSLPLRVPATRRDDEWALELLERDGVVVHPGSLYGFPEAGWLAVSLLPDPSRFRIGLERVVARVSGGGAGCEAARG